MNQVKGCGSSLSLSHSIPSTATKSETYAFDFAQMQHNKKWVDVDVMVDTLDQVSGWRIDVLCASFIKKIQNFYMLSFFLVSYCPIPPSSLKCDKIV